MPPLPKLVILFTRFPQVGKCKSRLIPVLGAEGALKVHKQLVSHVLLVVKKFLALGGSTSFHIYHDGGTEKQMKHWLGDDNKFRQQQGKDLGERMATALIHGLKNAQNTILIGSDCPGINTHTLENGLKSLNSKDLVLGPAHDGGYYLIGVTGNMANKTCRQLFEEIPWSTKHVFAKTLQQARKLGLKTHILTKLHDIDTANDLKYLHHRSNTE
jgi:rSAM/selenodomain-associated transferase 1